MKIYMLQLQADAERNDPIAKRILKKVDPRIKKIYLNLKSKDTKQININSMLPDKI